MIFIKQNKGQAAMTDSLFFLTIIVALCVLLFNFSSTYGERTDIAINNLYFKEYTNSSLKSIFYTDIPLNNTKNLDNSPETDYLITALKSDYLPDSKIGYSEINSLNKNDDRDLVKFNLYSTIKSLMYPLPNYDYLYYIQATSSTNFIFFMLKINEVENNEIVSRYYLCEPISINPIRALVQNSNKLYSSSTPLIFKINQEYQSEEKAVSNLTIWPSTSSIDNELITNQEIENSVNLKCKEYIEEP